MSLTPKQILAAELLADPSYQGTLKSIAKTAGITAKTLWKWRTKDTEFGTYVDDRVTALVRATIRPLLYRRLHRNIDHGDPKSIRDGLQAIGDIGSGGHITNIEVKQTTGEDYADRVNEAWTKRQKILQDED